MANFKWLNYPCVRSGHPLTKLLRDASAEMRYDLLETLLETLYIYIYICFSVCVCVCVVCSNRTKNELFGMTRDEQIPIQI